jgi:uncharacterized phage protein (TIGR02220 family)/predicted phage replisome organizer
MADALAKDKKYYWLKLKKDFFKRHDIQIIESMTNGKDYLLFYLKLLVESVDHDGNLRFNDTIPYNESMLATITNTNIDIVRSAMKIFLELKMIEVLEDETIYMNEIKKMLGTETYWAEKRREQRKIEKQKILEIGQCPTGVQPMSNVSKQEIDIDIELDKDKEIDIEKDIIPYQEIIDYLNQVCSTKYRYVESHKKHIRARWNEKYTLDDFKTVIDKKAKQWLDTKDAMYLRPETLFGTKFDGYLNQVVVATGRKQSNQPESKMDIINRLLQGGDDDN